VVLTDRCMEEIRNLTWGGTDCIEVFEGAKIKKEKDLKYLCFFFFNKFKD
jgi:hypothetical protein